MDVDYIAIYKEAQSKDNKGGYQLNELTAVRPKVRKASPDTNQDPSIFLGFNQRMALFEAELTREA